MNRKINGTLGEIKKRLRDKRLALDVIEKMATLATAGFGLVAALAWNSAIQDSFKVFFPNQESLAAKFYYAIIVTIVIVIITTKLGHATNKIKESIKVDEESEAAKSPKGTFPKK